MTRIFKKSGGMPRRVDAHPAAVHHAARNPTTNQDAMTTPAQLPPHRPDMDPHTAGLGAGMRGDAAETCQLPPGPSREAWIIGHQTGAELRTSMQADHARPDPNKVRPIKPPASHHTDMKPWAEPPMLRRGSGK